MDCRVATLLAMTAGGPDRATWYCTSTPSLRAKRGNPVRAMTSAPMGCHVATLLAMTVGGPGRTAWYCTSTPSLRAKRGNPVRAVAERPVDCCVTVLLAMTEGVEHWRGGQAAARGNRRLKLAVVFSHSVCSASPRICARAAATSQTNCGSLGLPRCGTGAR